MGSGGATMGIDQAARHILIAISKYTPAAYVACLGLPYECFVYALAARLAMGLIGEPLGRGHHLVDRTTWDQRLAMHVLVDRDSCEGELLDRHSRLGHLASDGLAF